MANNGNLSVDGWGTDPFPSLPATKAPIVLYVTEPRIFEALPGTEDERDGMYSAELRAKFFANFTDLEPIYDVALENSSLWKEPHECYRALQSARHAVNRLLEKMGYEWVGYRMESLEAERKRHAKAEAKRARVKELRAEAESLEIEADWDGR